MSAANLLKPFKLSRGLQLQHRVVMSPMTRFRADDKHVLADYSVEYYDQRTRHRISVESGGYTNAPGIYTEEQQNAWAKIVAAQVAEGRIADPGELARTGDVVPEPHMLTLPELNKYRGLFVAAAKSALSVGFDGVELHGANGSSFCMQRGPISFWEGGMANGEIFLGYLLNQFFEKVSNNRSDEYGGSPENRARFPLEVVAAVAEEIGEDRLAFRISPWDDFQEMSRGGDNDTYKYFIKTLAERHPKLAYLHVIESRVLGGRDHDEAPTQEMNNEEFLALWSPKPYISAGGHTRTSGIKVTDHHDNVLVAYGRQFLANHILRRGKNGYLTYPFATEATESLVN
ncbi:hypothetical protein BS47DRAFT_1340631 [Hydnum rufescens UP504]|uniref:NADH:flavin oxidoreductase/NADH oxidase N-terminal domain-containing protein n=1 Tax=Hydnum rufescens UP504 TaxID=1448309 RepID=A0A9P6B3K2_9AGAM|nr:hypothetical protein BS47DRAFT_1340631 [Hydnum rufescens UP504]